MNNIFSFLQRNKHHLVDVNAQLQETLNKLQVTQGTVLPQNLPIAHTSSYNAFKNYVVEDKALKPQPCKVFKKHLLYFYYGLPFYRSKQTHSGHYLGGAPPLELPVVFLFQTKLLSEVAYFYPYDTGAAAGKKFDRFWNQTLINFHKYKLLANTDTEIPRKLVYYIYENSDRYIRGEVTNKCKELPNPLPELYEFYTTDFRKLGIDHRQMIIECHIEKDISLKDKLMWISFPATGMNDFLKLIEGWNELPRWHAYEHHVNAKPSDIASWLEKLAIEEIKHILQAEKAKENISYT